MLFYGGIVLAAASALGMILYLLLARIEKIRLETQLDQEYGKSGAE